MSCLANVVLLVGVCSVDHFTFTRILIQKSLQQVGKVNFMSIMHRFRKPAGYALLELNYVDPCGLGSYIVENL